MIAHILPLGLKILRFKKEKMEPDRFQARANGCTGKMHDCGKADSFIADLIMELDLVKRQLDQFQASHMSKLHAQRMVALSHYRNEFDNKKRWSDDDEEMLDDNVDTVD